MNATMSAHKCLVRNIIVGTADSSLVQDHSKAYDRKYPYQALSRNNSMSVCLPFAWNESAHTGRIFVKFYDEWFLLISAAKFNFRIKSDQK